MDTQDLLNNAYYYAWSPERIQKLTTNHTYRNVLFEDPNTGRKIYKFTTGLNDGFHGSDRVNLHRLYNVLLQQEALISNLLQSIHNLNTRVQQLEKQSSNTLSTELADLELAVSHHTNELNSILSTIVPRIDNIEEAVANNTQEISEIKSNL